MFVSIVHDCLWALYKTSFNTGFDASVHTQRNPRAFLFRRRCGDAQVHMIGISLEMTFRVGRWGEDSAPRTYRYGLHFYLPSNPRDQMFFHGTRLCCSGSLPWWLVLRISFSTPQSYVHMINLFTVFIHSTEIRWHPSQQRFLSTSRIVCISNR